MNYGETLVYWFLRLNGFFPLRNFVLHLPKQHPVEGMERDQKGTADADILAIRLPHVNEEVGGQEKDWSNIFKDWGFTLETEIIALIVEVKTGDLSKKDIIDNATKAFGDNRIYAAIRRTGMFDEAASRKALEGLREQKVYSTTGPERIGKLFVTRQASVTYQDSAGKCEMSVSSLLEAHAFHITLDECEQFIQERMKKYRDRKENDRMFFPDDLIQYFAWKAGVNEGR